MIRFILGLWLCCFALALGAAEAKWYFDVPQAQAVAKKERKLVFIDFTGSDWCGWCMKLKQEVFSTSEFKNYAHTNLVLVEIDLPHAKPLSIEQLTANMRAQEQYHVEGFPTIIVLSQEGQEIWRLPSYTPGTAADWIRTMESLRSRAGLAPAASSAPKTETSAPVAQKKS